MRLAFIGIRSGLLGRFFIARRRGSLDVAPVAQGVPPGLSGPAGPWLMRLDRVQAAARRSEQCQSERLIELASASMAATTASSCAPTP